MKEETLEPVFSCEFCEISKIALFFKENLLWPLLLNELMIFYF